MTETPAGTPTAAPRQPNQRGKSPNYRNGIAALIILGIVIAIAGIAIAVNQAPQTTISGAGIYSGVSTTGSDGGYWAGNMIAGVGALFSLAGVIAWGVVLGLRAVSE